MMRFYDGQHKFYCGVDLHTKRMYLCILHNERNKRLHRNVRAKPRDFLLAIKRFRDDLVVGVECMFTWYWLADLCKDENIKFILGHALYMKAIDGGKKKDDKIGNPHLKWAFSEAALMMLRYREDAQQFLARKTKKHGKPRAMTMLARKISRWV